MSDQTFTAFLGTKRLARGTRRDLTALLAAQDLGPHPAGLLIFSDASGRETDLDLSGKAPPAPSPRGRGRPRLGVVAREVTLLPRHWDWLSGQRGGASATLRRLVDQARAGADTAPARRDAAFRFLNAIAGDLAGFETCIRALFAGDSDGFRAAMEPWPDDIRTHATELAAAD